MTLSENDLRDPKNDIKNANNAKNKEKE